MLAFLLWGLCGCLGGTEPSQAIYTAQMASPGAKTETRAPIARMPIDGPSVTAQADHFAERRAGNGNGLVVIAPPGTASGSAITRSPDGLFYVTAIVNGAPIRFLVDTGATMIVLRPDDARRAGVWAEEDAFRHTADTAGGKTAMARVTLDDVIVGRTRQRSLSAAVVRNDMPVSLLGQNWVAQLASLTISGDRLLFD